MRKSCAWEERVLAAVVGGARDPEVEVHKSACAVCRDAARAALFLAEAGRETRRRAHPPTAGRIYREALRRRREERARRATRILRLAQAGAVVASLVAAPALAAVGWESLWQWVAGLGRSAPDSLATGLQAGGTLLALAGGAATVMLYGLYARWATS
ncbi:MAG: hypothetical protein R3325_05425 [Thermoanaerobaculia bacterium]|nr:hypothetical protein [Thermoanaerobaculia bacterium]